MADILMAITLWCAPPLYTGKAAEHCRQFLLDCVQQTGLKNESEIAKCFDQTLVTKKQ